jgi:hypothetical protein
MLSSCCLFPFPSLFADELNNFSNENSGGEFEKIMFLNFLYVLQTRYDACFFFWNAKKCGALHHSGTTTKTTMADRRDATHTTRKNADN